MSLTIVNFILNATGTKINFATISSPGSEYRSGAGWPEGKGWWSQKNDIDSICSASEKIDLLLLGNSITQGWGGREHGGVRHGGREGEAPGRGEVWFSS